MLDNNDVFNYIQDNAKLYGRNRVAFSPHPLDWLHYETSFETVTGKKQDGSAINSSKQLE
jgi:iron complex outermembrane receptor protein